MTTKELIERLEDLGFHFDGQTQDSLGTDSLDFSRYSIGLHIDKNARHYSRCNGLTLLEWKLILEALVDYADTPLEQRNEPKYRVRLRGFNSENGHQYLTAQDDNVRATRFFACAEKPGLKQEFTQEELNDIANRNQFKGVDWFQDLIRHAEPVEEN